MTLTISQLRSDLTSKLKARIFKVNRWRALYLLVAYLLAFLHFQLTLLYLAGDLSLGVWAVSLLIAGNSGTFFFFSMHEILHGAVFRSKAAIAVSAFLGGIPFLCSPYVWRVWHNHHHRHTAEALDTDRPFHPDFDETTSLTGMFDDFAKRLQYNRIQSYLVPFAVISGHHFFVLVRSLFSRSPPAINAKRALAETIFVYAVFLLPMFFLGLSECLLGIYLPLAISHLICNCYILSNHFDNPLNDVNCPLVNSTSVYLSRYARWTHMGFGRHVEHHIYPQVTHDKLKHVRELLHSDYPSQFQERQLLSVLHSIYSQGEGFDDIYAVAALPTHSMPIVAPNSIEERTP